MENNDYEYAGFWVRFLASMIDSVLMLLITAPIVYAIYGNTYFDSQFKPTTFADIMFNIVFPLVASVLFWVYKSATPGKMALSLKVVDEYTGHSLTPAQAIGRWFGYLVSTIPLCIGFIWIGWDAKKQGFHDKLASTVVLKDKRGNTLPVTFDK